MKLLTDAARQPARADGPSLFARGGGADEGTVVECSTGYASARHVAVIAAVMQKHHLLESQELPSAS
jgi:hypothetical protein